VRPGVQPLHTLCFQLAVHSFNLLAVPAQPHALNFLGPPGAKARIAGKPYAVQRIEAFPDPVAASPGTVRDRMEDGLIVAVADGIVRVTARLETAGSHTAS